MSESNHVYENFEDALFRLIMDRVAIVEGEQLLRENEQLKKDPAAAVPEEIQNRCLRTFSNTFSKASRKNAQRTAWKVARVLVVAAAIITMLGIIAFAAIPAFRTSVLNILLRHENNRVDWEYVSPDNQGGSESENLSFSITIPEYYYLQEYAINEYCESAVYTTLDHNSEISVFIIRGEDMLISTDSEDVDWIDQVKIHGSSIAIMTQKDGFTNIFWSDPIEAVHIQISANALSRDDLLLLADSLVLE